MPKKLQGLRWLVSVIFRITSYNVCYTKLLRLREKLQILAIVILAISLAYTLENMSTQNTIVNTESTDQSMLINAEAAEEHNDDLQPIKKYDDTFTRIYNDVKNSVVQIKSTRQETNSHIIINGNSLDQPTVGLGSGFVYDVLGHIITNNHVIEGAEKVEITS